MQGQPVHGLPMNPQPQQNQHYQQQYQQQQQPYFFNSRIQMQPQYQQAQIYIVDPYSPMMPNMIMQGHFGRYSTSRVCPYCRNEITTITDHRMGTQAWILVLICLCIFWPCAFFPCILSQCKDVHHICPCCQRQLGVKEYDMCNNDDQTRRIY